MPEVYNWQLGRSMSYPYEESHSDRQFAFVFNINRCIACQTCTFACKSTWTFSKGQEHMWWNNVETKPYGGYPHHWDVQSLAKLGQQQWADGKYVGKTIFEKPEGELQRVPAEPGGELRNEPLGYIPKKPEWRFPNMYEDTASGTSKTGVSLPIHENFFFYLQRICNHCSYPACLAACPRKAIYKRPDNGIVLVDQKRCRGYQECMSACPYKKTLFNSRTSRTEKCIACYPRVETGQIPRCMAACVGSIRLSGWINPPDQAREDNPIDYLVHVEKVALPLYPQFGTQPNVYYIPPRWASRSFLFQMFGPGAVEAIQKRTQPSGKLIALLKLFGTTMRTIESFALKGETVEGYEGHGADRKRVVSVPLEEPFYERPFHDAKVNAHRFNEP